MADLKSVKKKIKRETETSEDLNVGQWSQNHLNLKKISLSPEHLEDGDTRGRRNVSQNGGQTR